MITSVLVRSMRSAGEVAAIARQIGRCAEDVSALAAGDSLLEPEATVLNAHLAGAMDAAASMMAVLDARLDTL